VRTSLAPAIACLAYRLEPGMTMAGARDVRTNPLEELVCSQRVSPVAEGPAERPSRLRCGVNATVIVSAPPPRACTQPRPLLDSLQRPRWNQQRQQAVQLVGIHEAQYPGVANREVGLQACHVEVRTQQRRSSRRFTNRSMSSGGGEADCALPRRSCTNRLRAGEHEVASGRSTSAARSR